jgi:3-phenylpropionate/trans-cinnamate dioxygenase ferredoxin subunit
MISEFIATISADSVPEGGMRSVTAAEKHILIARIEDEFFAISDICSHFHAHLSSGELLPESCQVQCPLHDSCFDLRTGEPSEPPAEDAVETYGVKIIDGVVHVGPKNQA